MAAFAESVAPEIAALATREIEGPARGPARALVKRARTRGEWRDDAAPEILLSTLVGAILHRALLERRPASRAWLARSWTCS